MSTAPKSPRVSTVEIEGEYYYEPPEQPSVENITERLRDDHTASSYNKYASWKMIRNKDKKLDDILNNRVEIDYKEMPAFRQVSKAELKEIIERVTRKTASTQNKHVSASNLTRAVHEEFPRFRKSSYKKADIEDLTQRLMVPTVETARKYHVHVKDYPMCTKLGQGEGESEHQREDTKVHFSEEDDTYSDSFTGTSTS